MNKVKTHPLHMYRGGAFGKTLFKKLSIAAVCALLFAAAPVFISCTNSSDSGGGNSGGETGGGTNTAETFTVSFSVEGGNGTLKAQSDGIAETEPSSISVEKGKTVTFTAAPDEDYRVKEWKLDGETVVGNTTNTFEHPVTKAVTVKVSFAPEYTPVPYANLADYLQGLPEDSTVHKIEITHLNAADLKGSPPSSGSEASSSPLGEVLKATSGKKLALKLPETIEGLTDMSYCFYKCENLVSVVKIPNGVTNMKQCFKNCTKLEQAPSIPNNVTNMEECFYGCTSLQTAPNIPNDVKNMSGCFSGCTNLTTAPEIPKGVTDIKYCFSGCTNLTTVPNIPDGVTDMRYCFNDCTNLTTAPTIPGSVTNMMNCFHRCTNLKTVPNIPDKVTNMDQCFYGCQNLQTVPNIPDGVTNMDQCFFNCKELTTALTIPNRVVFMRYCFKNCTNITSVTLKCNYLANRFDEAFSGCTGLDANSITVPERFYAAYTADKALTAMAVPGADTTEQKAKFKKF
ncbi:leucine-rich repeat domain-containing protein [Treponema socranskii]